MTCHRDWKVAGHISERTPLGVIRGLHSRHTDKVCPNISVTYVGRHRADPLRLSFILTFNKPVVRHRYGGRAGLYLLPFVIVAKCSTPPRVSN